MIAEYLTRRNAEIYDKITKDLSLSKIKFELTDAVMRRELVSGAPVRPFPFDRRLKL
jgi:hypothetical protein